MGITPISGSKTSRTCHVYSPIRIQPHTNTKFSTLNEEEEKKLLISNHISNLNIAQQNWFTTIINCEIVTFRVGFFAKQSGDASLRRHRQSKLQDTLRGQQSTLQSYARLRLSLLWKLKYNQGTSRVLSQLRSDVSYYQKYCYLIIQVE